MTVRNVYQTKDKCTINVTKRSEIFTVKLIYLIICQIVSMFGILGVMCNSVILCAKIIIHNNSDMYLVIICFCGTYEKDEIMTDFCS